jgi:23S rRNA pseudouridine1911/1915/1917 synthase
MTDADATDRTPPPAEAGAPDAPDATDEAFELDAESPSDDAGLRHFSWKLGKTLERRVDQYLVDRIGYLSRNEVQRLIDEGFVTVNGKKTKPSYKPKLNDVVAITAPPPRAATIAPEPIPLSIIYEDDHLLAINKQTNIIVHPARGVWNGTLVNALVHYGNVHGHSWSTINGAWRPGILHRLDRNTTGVMLVAKSDEAHWRLARQFEQRTIQKTYMALVHGIPELLADVIDAPIGRDKFIREKMAVRKIESGAKEAVTKYEVLDRITLQKKDDKLAASLSPHPSTFSLIRFSPKTGRTHQIRVHASHIGHPIVGDVIYGGKNIEASDGSLKFDRQALHAYQITFVHPITLKTTTLEAPLPADISSVVEFLKNN